jgi:hypothetical protein
MSYRVDQVYMKNLNLPIALLCALLAATALAEPGSCFIDEDDKVRAEPGARFFMKVRSGGKLPEVLGAAFGNEFVTPELVTKVKMMNKSYHYQVNKEVPLQLPTGFAMALFERDRAYVLPSCEVVPVDVDLATYAEE